MTVAFAISAASAAVKVTAILFFLAPGTRRARRHQAVKQPYVPAGANRAHRDPAALD
jgi:hypothetical protein